jgi:hypothetical protein
MTDDHLSWDLLTISLSEPNVRSERNVGSDWIYELCLEADDLSAVSAPRFGQFGFLWS